MTRSRRRTPRSLRATSILLALTAGACTLDKQGLGEYGEQLDGGWDAGLDASAGGTSGMGGTHAGGAAGIGGDGGTGGSAGFAGSGGFGGAAGAAGAADASTGDDGATGGLGGAAGDGGSAGAGGVMIDCAQTGDPMIALPAGFCIDATEVTRARYAAWLASNPTIAQPPSCSWNTSFAPATPCANHPKDVCQSNCDQHPQVCVDWCDAWSYCQAQGKRLCGSQQGGATPAAQYTDKAVDQWYRACSSDGAHPWTYGDAPGVAPYPCNFGHNSDTLPTVASGSMPGCQSPNAAYAGVFDLTGNAAEWQDSCAAETGAGDLCRLRGGSYDVGADSNRCDADRTAERNSSSFSTGFRCCYP